MTTTPTQPTKALIYSRVSGTHVPKGQDIQSQEARCRQHAQEAGYEVETAFYDIAASGVDIMKRPGIVALLSHLEAQRERGNYVVVVDDLRGIARDARALVELWHAFAEQGVRLQSVTPRFEDTPEGELAGMLMAAKDELEDKLKSRQEEIDS